MQTPPLKERMRGQRSPEHDVVEKPTSVSCGDAGNLDAVLPRLFNDEQWTLRQKMIDENRSTLLSEAADGRLAVILEGFQHDRRFQERIEAVRLALDDARNEGHDGVDRPLSSYLRPIYTESGPLASFQPPKQLPGDLAALSADERVQACLGRALLFAGSWEVRRRILAGYSASLASGDIENLLVAVARTCASPEHAELCRALAGVAATVRTRGPDSAAQEAKKLSHFSALNEREALLMTEAEKRQLALLAYIEAPTWPRRRQILEKYGELLLTDPGIELLDFIATRYGPDHPVAGVIPAARDVLVRSRQQGIEAVFSAPGLTPTHVRLRPRFVGTSAEPAGLRQAVHFIDPDLAPWTWSQINLALAAQLLHSHMETPQPFFAEEALLRVQDALGVISRADAAEWRTAQELLGRILLNRTRGDPATNLDAAIRALSAAAEALPSGGHAEEALKLLVGLAQAYVKRTNGVRATNFQTAAAYLEQAISGPCRERLPLDWAWAQVTFGQVCLERPFCSRTENCAEAAHHLEDALAVPELKVKLPQLWASAHLQLAHVCIRRPTTDPKRELAAAQEHVSHALEQFRRDTDARQWAAAQEALGAAYFRLCPDDPEARRRARDHFVAALEVFEVNTQPNERRRALTNLGSVLFFERRWAEAAPVLEEAVAINEYVEEEFARSEAGRLAAISDMGNVYERLAWCLLQLGNPEEALRILDAGKTHQLRRVLAVHGQGSGGKAEEKPESAWRRLRALVPEGGGLVVPVITAHGSAAFVLGPAGPERIEDAVIPLRDTTDKALRELLDGTEGHLGWLEAYGRWLDACNALGDYCEGSPEVEAELALAATAAETVWTETMTDACLKLWDVVLAPIHDRLVELGVPEGAVVVFLPSRWLFLLPIQAAWRQTPAGPRYLVDDYAVAVSPSVTTLAVARQGAVERQGAPVSLLAVIDPMGNLPHTQAERGALLAQLGAAAHVLGPESATPQHVADAAPLHTHLHFACHGKFEWLDPMGSGLTLAGGAVLSARDIAAGLPLPRTRCVALSACETGVVDTEELPYEYMGLAGAFLHSGVPAVLSSLWTVDDESTALLMATFYAEHAGGRAEPAKALRSAQIALRQRDEFKHPFYWAAFQLVGL